jgi:pyridoxine 4-dehydrogenase
MTSRMGLGALRLTDRGWGPPLERAAAVEVLRTAVDLGVGMIDTADSYGLGANEELIAEALHPYPAGVVVATKAGQSRPGVGEWVPLGRPEYLRQQAELSLRRLRVERVDLFYLHRVDPAVPLADQIGALAALRDEGKIARIGLSEVDVDTLEAARGMAEISAVQNKYSTDDRSWDAVLDHCTAEGIDFVPWRPIPGADDAVAEVAAELGVAPAPVALAWLLARSPVVRPIPGTASLEHLRQNMTAESVELSAEQIALIDRR